SMYYPIYFARKLTKNPGLPSFSVRNSRIFSFRTGFALFLYETAEFARSEQVWPLNLLVLQELRYFKQVCPLNLLNQQ
ncbi:MAG: hypothetical protein MJY76_08995, partial [Bacteroidales bacterium]|nr:hypothetical protein [Bacteroidales bacterium]